MSLPKPDPDCPECIKPLENTPLRVCFTCKKIIQKGHKWRMIPVVDSVPGLYMLKHRHCHSPDSYINVDQYRHKYGGV